MSRPLRIAIPLVAGLLALALAWGWTRAPVWLASAVTEKLVASAAKRGLQLQIGSTWLDPTDQLILSNVVIRDAAMPEPPLLQVARLEVDFELGGVLQPRVYLQQIKVLQPAVQVKRDAGGKTNVQAVLDRLLKPKVKDDDDEAGGGLRKYLSKRVPPMQVRGLTVAYDDDAGAPMQVGGLDARHLRLTGAADIDNHSPVQEKLRLEVHASARIAGLQAPARVDARLDWPEQQGELTVRLPSDVSVAVGDLRVQLGALTARSSGEVALGQVRVVKVSDDGQFGLDVREIAATLTKEAGPEVDLPAELLAKLPSQARQLLRHVQQVTVREPVIVARRPLPAQLPGDDDDDDDAAKAPDAKANLDDKAAPKPGQVKAVPPKGDKRTLAGKPLQSKNPLARQADPAAKPVDPADGATVRGALAGLFGKSADKLQAQVDKLRLALGSVPVPLVVVEHGAARYDDQRQGAARELSDFSGRIERKPGEGVVTLQLAFNVAGKPATNQIAGKFDVRTGEGEVKVQLDDLPLQPYAALLPHAVIAGPDSALRGIALSLLVNAPAGKMTLEGKGSLHELAVESPRLSRSRIEHIRATVAGKLDLDLKGERAELSQGSLAMGNFTVEAAGSIDHFRTAPLFKAHAAVPTVACQDVVDAIPPGFADTLHGMRCDGRLSYELRGSLDTANMDSLEFDFKPMLGEVKILTLGDKVDFSKFSAPFVHQAVRYRRHPQPGEPKFDVIRFQTGPGTPNWVPFDQVNPNFVKVITTTEDGGFFGHRGFIIDAIKSAAIANLKKGRFVRGASTITQQLVKNLFFVEREKTIARKLQEAVITWQIERTLTKQQMMELYLNIIELGPGELYGIGAASWHYFNRPPADLTLLQALWLGSIIPSPPAYYGEFMNGKASDSHRAMLAWVADVMLKREKITPEERSRLGDCSVVFGGQPDGSEEPPAPGLGYEGDAALDEDAAPRDPKLRAPAVDPDQQP